jgi:hypothetical protein
MMSALMKGYASVDVVYVVLLALIVVVEVIVVFKEIAHLVIITEKEP